ELVLEVGAVVTAKCPRQLAHLLDQPPERGVPPPTGIPLEVGVAKRSLQLRDPHEPPECTDHLIRRMDRLRYRLIRCSSPMTSFGGLAVRLAAMHHALDNREGTPRCQSLLPFDFRFCGGAQPSFRRGP